MSANPLSNRSSFCYPDFTMIRFFRLLLTLVIFFGLLLGLPALVNLTQQTTRTLSRATSIPANIVINVANSLGPLPTSYKALSQGGEETGRMFESIVPELKELSPRYIRIDHIYDFYHVVDRQNGRLVFDFSRLDLTVEDILATGALPFFSLSYMPTAISSDGTILGLPANWDEWSSVIRATIEHYSGRNGKNLSNVYYEVWNEPDIFGHFTIGGAKDYRQLYDYAAKGAAGAIDTNAYFFGGPATTSPQPGWINGLLQLATEKNLRLDFLSYHRYSADANIYERDAQMVKKNMAAFPRFRALPLVLSEWGPDSELNSSYDEPVSAAFTLSAIRGLVDHVSLIMPFEVKDGPSPSGQEYWGRWGVITHEKFGKHLKPRYHALRLLSKLRGQRLGVTGEGSSVSALGSIDNGRVQVLLVNYDQAGKNSEAVPVKVMGLAAAAYSVKIYDLTTELATTREPVINGELTKTILMPPQTIRLLELMPVTDQATYVSGKSGNPGDLALILDGKNPTLQFSPPQFILSRGTIEFSLKPNFETAAQPISLFTMTVVGTTGTKSEFSAKRLNVGFGTRLVFGLFENGVSRQTVEANITQWKRDDWHDVIFAWTGEGLQLKLDGAVVAERREPFTLGLGTVLTLVNNGAVIDNLRFTDGVRPITVRTFDGRSDQ